MRLYDFINNLYGNLTVKIFTENENGYFTELLREDKINDLKKECNNSFNILYGFNNELWEKPVIKWNINNNIVNIAI